MQKTTLYYSLVQCSEWAIDSCLYCYSSVFLLSCGLNNTVIGIVLSIGVVFSFLAQIFLGGFFNRLGRYSLKIFFIFGAFLLLCSNFLLFFFRFPNAFCIPVFIVCCLLLQLFPAFLNSAAIYEIQSGAPLNYGIGRGCGSLGYAVCTAIVGQLIARYGIFVIFLCGGLLSAVLLFGIYRFYHITEAYHRTVSKEPAPPHGQKTFSAIFLKKYRLYSITLAGAVLLMTGHTYVSNFLYQIVSAKGGNEAFMGAASAVAAICELPVLFLSDRFLCRFSHGFWLKVSGFILTAKLFLALISPSLPLLFLSECLQAGYALFTISSVYYTGSVIKKEDSISSQAYLNAASTLGVLFSLLSGGFLIDHFGVSALLFTGSLLAACGSFIISKTVFTSSRQGDFS